MFLRGGSGSTISTIHKYDYDGSYLGPHFTPHVPGVCDADEWNSAECIPWFMDADGNMYYKRVGNYGNYLVRFDSNGTFLGKTSFEFAEEDNLFAHFIAVSWTLSASLSI